MKKITYPISINYRKEWGIWEAIRELYQNSLDESESFSIERTSEGMVILDNGCGLSFKHLIIGVSEKKSDNPRGYYGEGLKIAMAVLLRLGYKTKIFSSNLYIETEVEELEGEPILSLLYSMDNDCCNGTRILIVGYNGSDFKDRIVIGGSKKIIFKNDAGQIIEEGNGSLYVRDIFCKDINEYMFSYNLNHLKLTIERNVVDPYDIRRNIGFLWSQVSDIDLIKRFLSAVNNKRGEAGADLISIPKENQDSWKKAFYDIFGKDSVIETSVLSGKLSRSYGARTIGIPRSIANILKWFISSDSDFIKLFENQSEILIKIEELSKQRLDNLVKVRSIVKDVSKEFLVNPYRLEFSNSRVSGMEIKINEKILDDLVSSVREAVSCVALIKSRSFNFTSSHLRSILDIASSIISNQFNDNLRK
uniref:Uncharacterized protein n=1 Tax=viral metagenome TaxID=1070528 RepID=A0A6M3IJT9_9ZZZZ